MWCFLRSRKCFCGLWMSMVRLLILSSKCFVTLMYQFLLGAIDSFTLKHAKLAKTNQGPFGAVYIAGRGLYQHAVRRQENGPFSCILQGNLCHDVSENGPWETGTEKPVPPKTNREPQKGYLVQQGDFQVQTLFGKWLCSDQIVPGCARISRCRKTCRDFCN